LEENKSNLKKKGKKLSKENKKDQRNQDQRVQGRRTKMKGEPWYGLHRKSKKDFKKGIHGGGRTRA